MVLEKTSTIIGMFEIFERVYDYLKGIKENREVQNQLSMVLLSLEHFDESIKSAKKTGEELREKVKRLNQTTTLQEFKDLMELSTIVNDSFRTCLSSICDFGRECHDLFSGDFEVFVQKVKTIKPDVYEIMNFFGRNYNPKSKTLDLRRLPLLIRLYGSKANWKENKKLSREADELTKEIRDFINKLKTIMIPKFASMDRTLSARCKHSVKRLEREGKRILTNREAIKEFEQIAPTWYIELKGILDAVQSAL